MNQGLAGAGSIVANSGAGTVGDAIAGTAAGTGGMIAAGREGEWGTLVSQGTQSVGGAFTPVYESVGTQVAGYGTAVGEATQYGLATQDSVSGVLQGITNAGLVA